MVTEVVSMDAVTDEPRRSSAMVSEPLNVPNVPCTLEIMRWRAVNPTVECEASMFQVPGVRSLMLDMWCAP